MKLGYFDENGYVKLRPKIGAKLKDESTQMEDKRLIDLCLNCEKPKCNGNCKEYKEMKKCLKNTK